MKRVSCIQEGKTNLAFTYDVQISSVLYTVLNSTLLNLVAFMYQLNVLNKHRLQSPRCYIETKFVYLSIARWFKMATV